MPPLAEAAVSTKPSCGWAFLLACSASTCSCSSSHLDCCPSCRCLTACGTSYPHVMSASRALTPKRRPRTRRRRAAARAATCAAACAARSTPVRARLGALADKSTRVIAEVMLESLPQCLLQSYLLVTVMRHVNVHAESDAERHLLHSSIDGVSFGEVLPRSITISVITMLKTWIELVFSAREAGSTIACPHADRMLSSS